MLAAALLCRAAAGATDPAETAVRQFFAAVRARNYRRAYGLLSPTIHGQISYADFAARSRDIRSFRVLRLQEKEHYAHLRRFYVAGKIRMRYRGQWFDAVYAGIASMTLSGGRWRVDEVDMKPTSQKRVGKAYHV